jgi:DNA (cytosine-5)-methyltransferase 1
MSERPRLLDLFCGAGGAAMGYSKYFDVVGVDNILQPHYPFEFWLDDALNTLGRLVNDRIKGAPHLSRFDAIHASPPCQAYSVLTKPHRNLGKEYPDLIGPTRELLMQTGLPWVIENVPGAPMRKDLELCGSQFGLKVRRHRWFEFSEPPFQLMPPCVHDERVVVVSGSNHRADFDTAADIIEAMGMPWATRSEVRQAIPPAFTEYVGAILMAHLKATHA